MTIGVTRPLLAGDSKVYILNTMPPKAPKAPITCNWMRSNVTDETLANFV